LCEKLFLNNYLGDTDRTENQLIGPKKNVIAIATCPTNISISLTKAEELGSGQNDSGMGQRCVCAAEHGT
jgi:hypothetical protein